MGYRDDFYVAANIVGYSGRLESFPSVYFLTTQEYGHITQEHDYSQNVGRSKVHSARGYTIGNEMVGSVLKLVEKMNGRIFHESRTTLTTVDQNDAETMAVLGQVIWKYQDQKYITDFSRADRTQIRASQNALRTALAGLGAGRAGLAHVDPSHMKGSGT